MRLIEHMGRMKRGGWVRSRWDREMGGSGTVANDQREGFEPCLSGQEDPQIRIRICY